jgi:hypothetical protein
MNESLVNIDQYFNGELTPEQKKAFEDRCLADPGFAKEVAFYIMMRDQAKEQWVKQKKQEFATLKESEKQEGAVNREEEFKIPLIQRKPGVVRKISTWKPLALAASVLIILALAVFFYVEYSKSNKGQLISDKNDDTAKTRNVVDTAKQKGNVNDTSQIREERKKLPIEADKTIHEQLVAKNFQVDSPPRNTEGVLTEAFNQYEEGNYKNAIRAYDDARVMVEEMVARSGEDEKELEEQRLILFYAHYYGALSQLAVGNAPKAISELKAIKNSPDKTWQNKVQWYLALAYLKTGKVRESEILLKRIADSKHAGEYKQKAQTLIDEIKSNK